LGNRAARASDRLSLAAVSCGLDSLRFQVRDDSVSLLGGDDGVRRLQVNPLVLAVDADA
jgi:hypothetical protein